jgi:hypothetical protein
VAEALVQAAHIADHARLCDLVEGLPSEHAAFAQDLGPLLERYAYDQIERRVRVAAGRPEPEPPAADPATPR